MIFHVKCYETVNFPVASEADDPSQAEELALANINSHEVISESVTDWNIEEIIPESEEWYAS